MVLPDTTERDCHVTFYPDFAGAQGVTPFEYFLRKLSEATDSAAIPENVQYFYRIAKTSAWCSIHLPKAWNLLVEVFLQKKKSFTLRVKYPIARPTATLGSLTPSVGPGRLTEQSLSPDARERARLKNELLKKTLSISDFRIWVGAFNYLKDVAFQ